MVVDDFDFIRISILPPEAYPVLLVDSDAVLPGPVTAEPLRPIPRRNRELSQIANAVQLRQLAMDNRPERGRAPSPRAAAAHPVEQVLRFGIGEGAYHASYYNGCHETAES